MFVLCHFSVSYNIICKVILSCFWLQYNKTLKNIFIFRRLSTPVVSIILLPFCEKVSTSWTKSGLFGRCSDMLPPRCKHRVSVMLYRKHKFKYLFYKNSFPHSLVSSLSKQIAESNHTENQTESLVGTYLCLQ